MSDIAKSANLRIQNGKFIVEGSVGFKVDGDKDGQAAVDVGAHIVAQVDVIEGLSELAKSSDSELLKKAAPFAEMILKSIMPANAEVPLSS